jgi:hypothetical protein
LLSTIVSFFFFIENPSDAVLAEKIEAMNVGSKSTIFCQMAVHSMKGIKVLPTIKVHRLLQ